ncbi:MAG: hypothetical protein ACSHX9_03785 [Luteolibacter sp.]
MILHGVAYCILVFSSQVNTREEVRNSLVGELGSGQIIEKEKGVVAVPHQGFVRGGVFERIYDRCFGNSSSVSIGGDIYQYIHGNEETEFVAYYIDDEVEVIEIWKSAYADDLKQQLQNKLPGVGVRILHY